MQSQLRGVNGCRKAQAPKLIFVNGVTNKVLYQGNVLT